MGAGASTITTIQNEYNFSGNNNGITSGDQGVYGTTTGASTDVKPTSDMNYSPQINPDFGNYLRLLGSGGRSKLSGFVSKTSNVIDSVRHIGAAAYRVAMGDEDLINKARDIIGVVSRIDDSKSILNGRETLPVDVIKNVSELQMEVVKRMPDAHDAYGTLALGMTGMRNSELNTRPTALSLAGCFDRASEGEKLNKDSIIELSGPRMGVVPKVATISSSTIIQETLDNTVTDHGSVGDLKRSSEKMVNIQREMKCSILHASSSQLSDAGILPTDSWETSEIIGMVRQHSVPDENGALFPGGQRVVVDTARKAVVPAPIDDKNIGYDFIIPTCQAYELSNEIHKFRDTYMILNGRVSIGSQPWPGAGEDTGIYLGLVYFNESNVKKFTPAYFINVNEYIDKKSNQINMLKAADVRLHKMARYETTMPLYKADETSLTKLPQSTNQGAQSVQGGSIFSYDSAFQLVVNLSKMRNIYTDQIYQDTVSNVGPFKAMLVFAMRKKIESKIQINISVASPIVRIETIANPEYMIYLGTKYSGSIIDMIATVPEWYTTGDHHDPVYLYKKFLEPFIPYLGRIADSHVGSEGAALQLSRDHVIRSFNKVGGSVLDTSDNQKVDMLIKKIILNLHDALYVTSVFADLKENDRKIVMMHFLEKVVSQSLTHINVWRDRSVSVRDHYARDCKEFNAIELEMDKKRITPNCN